MASWLMALEKYECAPVCSPVRTPLGEANLNIDNLKAKQTIKKKKRVAKPNKKPNLPNTTNNIATGTFNSICRKIGETTDIIFNSFFAKETIKKPQLSLQATEPGSSLKIIDENFLDDVDIDFDEDQFPIPNFSEIDEKSENILMDTFADENEMKLPFNSGVIEKNRQFLSPTRPRTPGHGILSPQHTNRNRKSFQSPTYRDLFGSPEPFTFNNFINDDISFSILDEECQYDSDDYFEEDQRFPKWSRGKISDDILLASNKEAYDKRFTSRDISSIEAKHLYKGHSSEEFDTPIDKNSNLPPYANIKSFQIGRPVGQGKFGTIYLARVKPQKDFIVAIKVMFKSCLTSGHVTQLIREIRHLDTLRNNNIISLFDFFHDENRIYLVMEYADGGDLYHSLSAVQKFTEPEAASIFLQSAEAIKTCHDNGIVHRDIKPENFVWGAGKNLKLIDFGWSAPCDIGERRKTFCGTLDYLPPEMVVRKPYGQMADIWCLGVLLFELLTGRPPFEDNDFSVTKLNIKYVSYTTPDYVSRDAKKFISEILKADPLCRPTIEDLISHPWVVRNTSKK